MEDQDTLLDKISAPLQSLDTLSFCGDTQDAFEKYLERLPHNNPAEVLYRLYQAAPEVAALKAGPGKKIALLDSLCAPVLEYLEKFTAKQSFNEKTSKVYSLCVSLLRHIADGYKSVVMQASKNSSIPPQILAKALNGALSCQIRVLLLCWHSYLPIPNRYWLEIHTLYQIARRSGLTSTSLKNCPFAERETTSIEDSYLAILMVCVMDPYGKNPKDLNTLFGFFIDHVSSIKLTNTNERGLFSFDPDSDQGPSYSSKQKTRSAKTLWLNPSALIAQINTGSELLPIRLTRQIIRYCSSEVKRRDEHSNDETPALMVRSLSKVHHLLSKIPSIDAFVATVTGEVSAKKNTRMIDNILPKEFAVLEEEGNWMRNTSTRPEDTIRYAPVDEPSGNGHQGIKASRVTRINKSDHGARLRLNTSDNLKPGELVAIRLEGSETWQAAAVRWTRVDKTFSQTLGVEYLPGRLTPCAAAIVKADKNISPYFSGLIMEREDEDKQIILPSMPFVRGNRIRILYPGNQFITQLVTQGEATYHISCFTIGK